MGERTNIQKKMNQSIAKIILALALVVCIMTPGVVCSRILLQPVIPNLVDAGSFSSSVANAANAQLGSVFPGELSSLGSIFAAGFQAAASIFANQANGLQASLLNGK